MMTIQAESKALQMINNALKPIVKAGRSIDRIKLMVSPLSKLAEYRYIDTDYGRLWIKTGEHLPRGSSYLIEDPGMKGRGFAWVSRRAAR